MITNKNEAKAMRKKINLSVNANSIAQHVIQIQNGIIKHVNVNVKIIVSAKKIVVGILAHIFVRIVSILNNITDNSEIEYDDIMSVMNIVSTKRIKTIVTNVTKNRHSKQERDILRTVSVVVLLLLIFCIISYHYGKTKRSDAQNEMGMEI